MAVHFDEAFVGGFFGFRRTYGAVARIVTDSPATLKQDLVEALAEVRLWRERRGEMAAAIHFFFVVPSTIADKTRAFVSDALLALPEPPKELVGLVIDAVIFDDEGGVAFEATLRPA